LKFLFLISLQTRLTSVHRIFWLSNISCHFTSCCSLSAKQVTWRFLCILAAGCKMGGDCHSATSRWNSGDNEREKCVQSYSILFLMQSIPFSS